MIVACVPAGTHVRYGVHNSDMNTALRGVVERLFLRNGQPPIRPHPQTFAQRWRRFGNLLARKVGSASPISFVEFIGLYQGRKGLIYQHAVDKLRLRGVRRSDAYVNMFVKAEKLNLTAKPDPSPRIIQPRSPVYNAAVGVFLKPAEHKIYNKINEIWGSTTVAKGLNARRRGEVLASKWAKFRHPVAVGADASRFDQHVSVPALRAEHQVYNRIFNSPLLRKLLRWQLDTRGFVRCKDGSFRYRVEGSRMSGDMNTALGNVIIMCGLVWSYCDQHGIRAELLNDGDDCVIIVEETDLHRFDEFVPWFAEMGFPMVMEEPVRVLEEVVFCQAQPVFDGESWVMVRDPRTAISKDLVSLRPVRNAPEWRAIRRAVGECGMSLAGNIPVWGEVYAMIMRGTDPAGSRWRRRVDGRRVNRRKHRSIDYDAVTTGMRHLARGMHQKHTTPTEAARYSFWKAFGWLPDVQNSLEETYRAVQPEWDTPSAGLTTAHPDVQNLFHLL
jgi:hypothetical protein